MGGSRTRSTGRYVSPSRRRPRLSSPPPRRPLHERIQRSHSPRPSSGPRPRSRSPRNRRPQDRRLRTRTSTPISSSRGHTPPHKYGKSERSPRTVKVEPSTETVLSVPSNTVNPAPGGPNASGVGDQPPVLPRASVDRNPHQGPSSLNLSLGEHATAASTSQPPSTQADPLSPVFAPETPLVPGFSASSQITRPQMTTISALQKSLEQVIKDQTTNPIVQPSNAPPSVNTSTSRPAPIPEREKTEIWTTRVKCVKFVDFVTGVIRFADIFFDKLLGRLWADMMKTKSEVMDWEDEVKMAQSLKHRAGFDAFSPEAQAQVDSRIAYAMKNLVQHKLAFEALVSQSVALDQSVSKANAALAPAPAVPDPRAATPREIEWMQEHIKAATARADELEKKLALQDQLLERLKKEQEAVEALPPLPPATSSGSPMEVDDGDGDGVLDNMPSLKRKRKDDDDPQPSSRRRSLARDVANLQEANEVLADRIAEVEDTIEGILNDVVEGPEGEESSRVIRLKEIFQDYQTFIENAKTAVEVTECNSRVVEALKTEAERAIADWNEAYQEFETVRDEATEIHIRAKGVSYRSWSREPLI